MKQYTRCVTTVARFDYPTKWASIADNIQQALESGNMEGIMTGLLALFALAKKYEYEMDEEREPLFKLMEVLPNSRQDH